jgi:hypothetical protein
MPLKKVDFLCPKCQMFCKSNQALVEIERTDERVAYGHERCYRVNDGEDTPQKED